MALNHPLFKKLFIWIGLIALGGLWSCSSGTPLLDPKIEVDAIRITRVQQDSFEIEGNLRIFNPNEVSAEVLGYQYRMDVEGRRLVGGESAQSVPIASQDTFRVTIPGKVYFQDLMAAGKKALTWEEITYTFSGTVFIYTPIGKHPVPFAGEGQLNLSEILRAKTRQFLQGL
jgi:LEA14-like dessication related protein